MSIKHALLSVLAQRPCGVGRLRTTFNQLTTTTWPLNIGQVYQTAQRLERDGLITLIGQEPDPESGRTTDVYEISNKGKVERERWFTTATLKSTNDRDELVIKIAIAVATQPDNVMDFIQSQREAVMSELSGLTRKKAHTPAQQSAQRLLMEKQIFDLEATARWLDHIETLSTPDFSDTDKGQNQ